MCVCMNMAVDDDGKNFYKMDDKPDFMQIKAYKYLE